GSFMIPSMKDHQYKPGFAAAITASAGSIGVLIPPSIPFVMYGVVGTVSIGSMFLAGIIPGLILGAALMISSYITAKRNGYAGTGESPSFTDVLQALNEVKVALLVTVMSLGGMCGGFFSPTAAAAVASIFAMLLVVLVYNELDLKAVYKSFSQAALTNA